MSLLQNVLFCLAAITSILTGETHIISGTILITGTAAITPGTRHSGIHPTGTPLTGIHLTGMADIMIIIHGIIVVTTIMITTITTLHMDRAGVATAHSQPAPPVTVRQV